MWRKKTLKNLLDSITTYEDCVFPNSPPICSQEKSWAQTAVVCFLATIVVYNYCTPGRNMPMIYIEKDVFVHTWVLYVCLIEICVMTYWVPEKSESWSYRICKVWSTKFTRGIFPLVHLDDAAKALIPNTNYFHFSKYHKHHFIIGSEKLAELLPFPTYRQGM